MKSFLAFLKIDLKLAMRNRAVLFFNYLFPLLFFFMFSFFFARRGGSEIVIVVTMVTVIGILGTGFFGAGMRAVQEREENILRRYKVTPITPVPLLMASVVMGIILYLPTVTHDVVFGEPDLRDACPFESLFAFCLRLSGRGRFSIARPHYRSGR